ncbi:hypothetical protein EEB14_55980 [Rhodococcus sp. WS4]|nr:hypothetical protein EEB14_55980 [Rhodococcus sp. WS4]
MVRHRQLGQPPYFLGVGQKAMSATAREDQALFMGPRSHLLPYSQPTPGGTGDIDFGPEAAYPLLQSSSSGSTTTSAMAAAPFRGHP